MSAKDGTTMTEQDQIRIFMNNLKRLMDEKNVTQKELADAIGVSPQAINFWCTGRNLPRMDKIQNLANYFGVTTPDLINEHDSSLEETLQEAFDRRPEMRTLFDAAQDCTKEQIELAISIVEAMRDKNMNK